MLTVFKRECRAYMNNLYGFVFIAILVCVVDARLAYTIVEQGLPGIESALYYGCYALIAAAPLLAMRSMAEDRKNGTDRFYRALPIGPSAVVLGKYAALLAVLAIPTVVFALYIVIFSAFGTVHFANAYLALLLFFLVGAGLLALGQFLSALTKRPLLAGAVGILLAAVVCLAFLLRGVLPDGIVVTVLESISPIYHVQGLVQYSIFSLRSLFALLLFPVLFVFLTLMTVLVGGGRRPAPCPIAVGALLLAALIGVNAALPFLPLVKTEYNTDRQSLAQIPPETNEFLEELDQDITIYWLRRDGVFGDVTLLDEWFVTLLERYEERNPHITVLEITDADEVDEWAEFGLNNYDMIVSNDLDARLDVVHSGELFTYSNNYINQQYSQEVIFTYEEILQIIEQYRTQGYDIIDYTYMTSCVANAALTAALDYVTTEEVGRPYLLTGYEGASLPAGLERLMAEYDSDMLTEVDISRVDAIPADASCVLLHAPTADLGEREAAVLEAYLSSGGSLVLTTSPALWTKGASNLQALLSPYGLTALSGVVFDSASGSYVSSTDTLVPQVNSQHSLSTVYSSDKNIRMPWSHAIGISASATAMPIFATSETAVRKPGGGMSETLGDPAQYYLAVHAARTVNEDAESQVIWFGSTDAFTDTVANTATANYLYLIQSVSLLSGEYVSPYASLEGVELLTDAMQEMGEAPSAVFVLIFVGILPLAILTGGVAIWLVRRRRTSLRELRG